MSARALTQPSGRPFAWSTTSTACTRWLTSEPTAIRTVALSGRRPEARMGPRAAAVSTDPPPRPTAANLRPGGDAGERHPAYGRPMNSPNAPHRVLVAGGGVAGLEALCAL